MTGRGSIKYWVLGAVAMVASFGLVWLPQINGPHLWLGLPSILWWTCVPGSLLITPLLWIYDRWQDTDNPDPDADEEEEAGA